MISDNAFSSAHGRLFVDQESDQYVTIEHDCSIYILSEVVTSCIVSRYTHLIVLVFISTVMHTLGWTSWVQGVRHGYGLSYVILFTHRDSSGPDLSEVIVLLATTHHS
jgi:hypothetical protein